MAATVSDLLAALPEGVDVPDGTLTEETLDEALNALRKQPIPTGALRRFGSLTGLHAKYIADMISALVIKCNFFAQ